MLSFASVGADQEFQPIGVWTRNDPAKWAAEAYRRIYERELLVRLPDARVRFVGNLSDDAVAVSERGDIMTSLSACREEGWPDVDRVVVAAPEVTDLLAFSDAIQACQPNPPEFVLSAVSTEERHTAEERERIAHVVRAASEASARNTESLNGLRDLGALRVDVVADPLLLLSRLTAPGVIQSRVEYLRAMDGYPLDPTVLVEVSASRMSHLAMLQPRIKGALAAGYRLHVVAVPCHGDTMSTGLRRCLEQEIEPLYCIDRPTLEDLAAIVASSAGVFPLSQALFGAACAYGRPVLRCLQVTHEWRQPAEAPPSLRDLICDDFGNFLRTSANPSAAESSRTQLAAHFDRIADRVSTPRGPSTPLRPASSRAAQLETAHRVAGRHRADERLRFAERTESLLAEIAQLKADLARRTIVEAQLRHELAAAWAQARLLAFHGDTSGRLAPVESAARRSGTDVTTMDELEELRAAVRRFEQSRSWRYLAPVRAIAQMLRRWRGARR